MDTLFVNKKGLCEMLSISVPTADRLLKIIREHEGRYGRYAIAGNRYYIPAVVDASTYRAAFVEGLDEFIPDYDPGAIAEMVRAVA